MGDVSQLPTKELNGETVTRAGWPFSDDEPMPGDTIPFPPALTTTPRSIENEVWTDDLDEYAEAEPDLTVERLPEDEEVHCGFCNPPDAVAERDVVGADVKLVAPDGTVVTQSCHCCIADAEHWEQ